MNLGLGFLFLNVLAIVIIRGTLLCVRGHDRLKKIRGGGRRVVVEEGNRRMFY